MADNTLLKAFLKITWLAILIASILLPYKAGLALLLINMLGSLLLLAYAGKVRWGLTLIVGFGSIACIIIGLNYVTGSDYITAAKRLLYTISTALFLSYIALTTPASEVRALLGRNVLTQTIVFTNTLKNELQLITESFKARGHRVKGPKTVVPVLVAFLSCVIDRMDELDYSLKARGAE